MTAWANYPVAKETFTDLMYRINVLEASCFYRRNYIGVTRPPYAAALTHSGAPLPNLYETIWGPASSLDWNGRIVFGNEGSLGGWLQADCVYGIASKLPIDVVDYLDITLNVYSVASQWAGCSIQLHNSYGNEASDKFNYWWSLASDPINLGYAYPNNVSIELDQDRNIAMGDPAYTGAPSYVPHIAIHSSEVFANTPNHASTAVVLPPQPAPITTPFALRLLYDGSMMKVYVDGALRGQVEYDIGSALSLVDSRKAYWSIFSGGRYPSESGSSGKVVANSIDITAGYGPLTEWNWYTDGVATPLGTYPIASQLPDNPQFGSKVALDIQESIVRLVNSGWWKNSETGQPWHWLQTDPQYYAQLFPNWRTGNLYYESVDRDYFSYVATPPSDPAALSTNFFRRYQLELNNTPLREIDIAQLYSCVEKLEESPHF